MKLSDKEILNRWHKFDSKITHDYFYPYHQVAWYLNDKHYGPASKRDMDSTALRMNTISS
jgi:hypothetical protein